MPLALPLPSSRFQARWTNGYWKLFDALIYADLAIVGLQIDAFDAAAAANRRP